MTLQSEIVKEYLQKYPDLPTLTLAKTVYKKHNKLWRNPESIRASIKYYRGKNGKKELNKLTDKTFVETKERPYNPFDDIPEGIKCYDNWEPYPIICEKALIIADIHAPFHNRQILELILQYAHAEGVDTIEILGDLADFYSVSFWEKDPSKRNFKRDRDVVVSILDVMRKMFPNAQIIYKIGNHEERYERYMKVKAPEIFDIEDFQLGALLHLDELKIKMVGDRRITQIGGLNLIHGHEFGRSFSSPVNPARGLYLKGKENCLGAHHHQSSHHAENSMNDAFTGCWSIGCVCDMHPDYLPINKWNYGFAIVNRYSDKEFEVFNKKIINNKIYEG